jgi:hypothetical protein
MRLGTGLALRACAARGAAALLLPAMAMPVAGGAVCSLQATVGGGSATEVPVGEEVLIEGFGFPPGAEVELAYDVDGTPIGTDTVTADGGGLFETSVTPQPGDEGLWTVTATVTNGCAADTGFLVVGPPATATPTPTPSATAAATPAASELPNVAVSRDAPSSGSRTPLVLLAGVAALGLSGVLAARRLAHRTNAHVRGRD